MDHRFKRWFAPPVFPDDEDTTRAMRVLYALLTNELVIIAFAAVATLFVFQRKLAASLLLLLLLTRMVIAHVLARRGHVRWASLIWIAGFWLFSTILVLLTGHIATTAITLYLAVPVLAGLLLGPRHAILVAILSSLICLGMALCEVMGYPLVRYLSDSPLSNWFVLLIAFSFTIPPLYLTIQGFGAALDRARRSEQRYVALFEAAPVMYAIIHMADGRPIIAGCNAAFLCTLGYQRDQVVGHALDHLYAPDSQVALREVSAQQPWLSEEPVTMECELVTSDGRVIQTLSQVAPERNAMGRVIGHLAMYLDITGRKHAEAELRASEERYRRLSEELEQRVEQRTAELQCANEELAKALRAKDAFLAAMSHELRTPLNGIVGTLGAFEPPWDGQLTGTQRKIISIIETSGQRLHELINEVLEFTTLQSGTVRLYPHACSVQMVCQWALQAIQVRARPKHQRTHLTITPEGLVLLVDEQRLHQLLKQLLSNASKFTPDGEEFGIEVTGNREARQVMLTVWDRGIGIAAEDLPRLFQPFVQLDARLARQYEGAGLGLALVKQLAELLGGRVSVASVVGQGSRFTVTLPWMEG